MSFRYEHWKREYTRKMAGQIAVMDRDMQAAYEGGYMQGLRDGGVEMDYWDRTCKRWVYLGLVSQLAADAVSAGGHIKLRLTKRSPVDR